MTVLTITTFSSETKVLLKPPMTEAREIKFLSTTNQLGGLNSKNHKK